jgi:hypothetical protein
MSHPGGLEALRAHLAGLEPGPVSEAGEVESLLAACWDRLDGSDAEGMNADKLSGRAEKLEWDPPVLSFVIARHGGTVMGSSRAEVHGWRIDVVDMTAHCSVAGHRQLRPMAPRLAVGPLARETADLIRSGKPDPTLKWRTDGEVRVLIGKIITEGAVPKQTLAGRRKRFWAALDEQLQGDGWVAVGHGTYRRQASG